MDYFEAFKWRWSHTHHHSRTIHLDVDYEIQVARPANLWNLFVTDAFAIDRVWAEFKSVFWHSLGIMTPIAKDCVPTLTHSFFDTSEKYVNTIFKKDLSLNKSRELISKFNKFITVFRKRSLK